MSYRGIATEFTFVSGQPRMVRRAIDVGIILPMDDDKTEMERIDAFDKFTREAFDLMTPNSGCGWGIRDIQYETKTPVSEGQTEEIEKFIRFWAKQFRLRLSYVSVSYADGTAPAVLEWLSNRDDRDWDDIHGWDVQDFSTRTNCDQPTAEELALVARSYTDGRYGAENRDPKILGEQIQEALHQGLDGWDEQQQLTIMAFLADAAYAASIVEVEQEAEGIA